MKLDKYLAVGGAPGIHKLVASRGNGIIIEDRQEGRTRFVPTRGQQVTPLATVAVYTFDAKEGEGTLPLVEVFQKMLDAVETIPPVSPNAQSQELRDYFSAVLPEHDRDRVHINDIKKCLKWFLFMREKGIFEEAIREAEAEAEKAKAETAPETKEETN